MPAIIKAADIGEPGDRQWRRFENIIRSDPDLMRLLVCLRAIGLPEWRLVAGCLYQTVWNVLTARPRGTGIKDYDLIYFASDDLSWEAEDAIIRRVAAVTTGCVGPVEVRNQARVHLWFEGHFGAPYSPLSAADEALQRYASVVHAIGVRLEADGRLDIVAPFGFDDLFAMLIRPNRVIENAASHLRKAKRAQSIWPEVIVIPWDEETDKAHPGAVAVAAHASSGNIQPTPPAALEYRRNPTRGALVPDSNRPA